MINTTITMAAATAIVHHESFRSNVQNAIAFARRNRPCVNRNDEFACDYLRSRAFAFTFVCEYCSRSTACARTHVRTCIPYSGKFSMVQIFAKTMKWL